MTTFNLQTNPHRRFNPLLNEWVLVSPQRNLRPWQGQNEALTAPQLLLHDPNCYLCPGNARSGGEINPNYEACFVFDNDFPALASSKSSSSSLSSSSLPITPATTASFFQTTSARGINRVICYDPRHDLTMSGLSHEALLRVIETWKTQFEELAALPYIDYVQIFENKGAIMGCSNPHPHGQIWAQEGLPSLVARTQQQLQHYYNMHQEPLLNAYLQAELEANERIIYQNQHFVVLVPFWAVWPFETIIIPKNKIKNLAELDAMAMDDFALALSKLTKAYDAIFKVSFPYSAGFHQAPCDGLAHPEWTLHMHFYPPLLRSASVKKFQVGYEMLAEAQRDMTPEQSAEILRSCLI
ncbi:MAG: UDP-glucose--hexose-1-phosphate uridylyltransferase [Flavobacteriales bacterium]